MRRSRTVVRNLSAPQAGNPRRPRKPQRRTQPGDAIGGLPALGAGDLLSVAPDGTHLATTNGRTVQTFRLVRDGQRARVEPLARFDLPGHAAGIVHGPDGALYAHASTPRGDAILALAGEQARPVYRVSGTVIDFAITRAHVVVAVAGQGADKPRLLVVRRRDGRVAQERPLTSSSVRLRAGRRDEVLLVDRGVRQLRVVDTSRIDTGCPPPDGGTRPEWPPINPQDPTGCRACRPKPCTCHPPSRGSGSSSVPGGRPGVPPRRDPDGHCVPGDDGEPDGCIITYAFGALLITVNICEPQEEPCAARLDREIGSVHRTRRAVVAVSSDRRRVTLLDRTTMRVLHERRAMRSALRAYVARDADLIFLRDATGSVALFDPAPVLPSLQPAAGLTTGTSSAVFLGTSAGVAYDPGGHQRGVRRVLIVPVLEPGQGFSAAGTTSSITGDPGVAEILERVQAFYLESTRHAPPDLEGLAVEFIWFGADTPELYAGPPITLPFPLAHYWGPAWDPGHVKGVVPVPPGGMTVQFSGDESMSLVATPSPEATYDPRTFELRFPAASYSARIPNLLATINLGSGPVRSISVDGTDRQGNAFSLNVDTGALPSPVAVDLNRTALEGNADQLDALADAIQEMLDSAPGQSGLFERPRVLWHDDGEETGMLHVSLSFAAGGGATTPRVTAFNLDGLLPELGSGSLPASFAIPGSESVMAMYLWRIVADASVSHPDFGSDLSVSYFELVEKWSPTVTVDSGEMTVRISLSTNHGRAPARIDVGAQTSLAIIGMHAPQEVAGADTKFSGGGGPMFDKSELFDHAFTGIIDRTIAQHGAEQFAINLFNQYFNCAGLTPIECMLQSIHAMVVTSVYPSFNGTGKEPALDNGERANANRHETVDTKAAERAIPVLPFGGNRATIVTFIAPDSLEEPDRGTKSAATLAHELGHGLVGLPDLYGSSGKRLQAEYLTDHCIMASSSSFSHFCAYNQRVKGWLDEDAILVLDRPGDDEPIDQELVLIQLEHWDPLLDAAQRVALAQAALPGMPDDTPVRAAAFLRLGGDGRQFDIVELRGRGVRFSDRLTPSRILISNAIDPEDDTRHATDEVEGAGTTRNVLERYRVKVHLMSADLRAAGDVYDFATSAEFPEVGLEAEVLEWGATSNVSGTFDVARIRIQWTRGRSIDLGFVDSTPGWQSPDIAVIRPEFIDEDGGFTFPEDQNAPDEETFRIPKDPDEELMHKVAVRVWNFGDAPAENVQIGLIRKHPGGSGDWKTEFDTSQVLPDPVQPSADAPPPVIAFDWPVSSAFDTHVCFRGEIGDRDVPRDDNGVALASDDTNGSNDWAQQNAFIFDAEASSPPAPVEFTHQVDNQGSYVEEVTLHPRGLGSGARVTITPARLFIAPFSRGLFRVKVELEEELLKARCGKDITFVLEAWRQDDHSDERWGGAKYTIRPRFRTQTHLQGAILPDRLTLFGSVTPDVGAQRVLLHVQRLGRPSIWEEVPLGPGSTFDYQILDDFPPHEDVRAVAYYDGSLEYAKSVSEPVVLHWVVAG